MSPTTASVTFHGDSMVVHIIAEQRRRPFTGAEKTARLERKRRARGECLKCRAPRDPTSVRLCARCLRRERERQRRIRERRRVLAQRRRRKTLLAALRRVRRRLAES